MRSRPSGLFHIYSQLQPLQAPSHAIPASATGIEKSISVWAIPPSPGTSTSPSPGVATELVLSSAALVGCSLATPLRRLRPAHAWALGFPSKETRKVGCFSYYSC